MSRLVARRARAARRAMTLAEILIAVGILALASVPFLISMTSGAHEVGETRDYLLAVEVAQRTIEEVRGLDYTKIIPNDSTNCTGTPPTPGANDPIQKLNSTTSMGGVDYKRTVKVGCVKGPLQALTLTVSVQWTPPSARSRPITGTLEFTTSTLLSSALQL